METTSIYWLVIGSNLGFFRSLIRLHESNQATIKHPTNPNKLPINPGRFRLY